MSKRMFTSENLLLCSEFCISISTWDMTLSIYFQTSFLSLSTNSSKFLICALFTVFSSNRTKIFFLECDSSFIAGQPKPNKRISFPGNVSFPLLSILIHCPSNNCSSLMNPPNASIGLVCMFTIFWNLKFICINSFSNYYQITRTNLFRPIIIYIITFLWNSLYILWNQLIFDKNAMKKKGE